MKGLCSLRELGLYHRMGGWMFTWRTLLTHPKQEKYCQGTIGAGGSWGPGTVRAPQKHWEPPAPCGQGLCHCSWKKPQPTESGISMGIGQHQARTSAGWSGPAQWGPWVGPSRAGLQCSGGCSSGFRASAGKQLPWAGVGPGHDLFTALPGSCSWGKGDALSCPGSELGLSPGSQTSRWGFAYKFLLISSILCNEKHFFP